MKRISQPAEDIDLYFELRAFGSQGESSQPGQDKNNTSNNDVLSSRVHGTASLRTRRASASGTNRVRSFVMVSATIKPSVLVYGLGWVASH